MVFKWMNIEHCANDQYCIEIHHTHPSGNYQFFATYQDLEQMRKVLNEQLCIKLKIDDEQLFVRDAIKKIENDIFILQSRDKICQNHRSALSEGVKQAHDKCESLERKYNVIYDENCRLNRVIDDLGGYEHTNLKQLCETNRDDIKKLRGILGEASK